MPACCRPPQSGAAGEVSAGAAELVGGLCLVLVAKVVSVSQTLPLPCLVVSEKYGATWHFPFLINFRELIW